MLPGRARFLIYYRPAQDIQSHKDGELATFTSDTVEHDILPLEGGQVTDPQKRLCPAPMWGDPPPWQVGVYNLCTDTTRHMNGIVTNMHPSEGVWLFRWPLLRCLPARAPCP